MRPRAASDRAIHDREVLIRDANEFLAQVHKHRTGAAVEMVSVIVNTLAGHNMADGWIALASGICGVLRSVPDEDIPALMMGLTLMVDQMMQIPDPTDDN